VYANARNVLDDPRTDLDQALAYRCELSRGQRAGHRSREFIEFLKLLDAAYPTQTAIKLIIDTPRTSPRRPEPGLRSNPRIASNSP
jgi:hypothetical protein